MTTTIDANLKICHSRNSVIGLKVASLPASAVCQNCKNSNGYEFINISL